MLDTFVRTYLDAWWFPLLMIGSVGIHFLFFTVVQKMIKPIKGAASPRAEQLVQDMRGRLGHVWIFVVVGLLMLAQSFLMS